MGVARAVLLAASQNRWMRERAARFSFIRRSVRRFMPGETLDDALGAARELQARNRGTVLTQLGENVADAAEARQVVAHYLEVLRKIHAESAGTEISVKLTQLGLDLSPQLCEENLRRLLAAEIPGRTIWIDMEASPYVETTLELYRNVLAAFPTTGICLQAYLRRTQADIESLMPLKPSVRLVKGAYAEAPEILLKDKAAIDANYLALAQHLLRAQRKGAIVRAAFATHDAPLIRAICEFAQAESIANGDVEIQMLYGIQTGEQQRLVNGGWRCGVLIAYGTYWYPWFMRRLAERPANLWFLVKNLTGS